jgi:formate--tetrahydrofolate ligase
MFAMAVPAAQAAEQGGQYAPLYPSEQPLSEKIECIATRVYGAEGIDLSPLAKRQLEAFAEAGYAHLPVCIAKTHLSLSSDPALRGAPTGWRMPVREARLSAGAGFVYVLCGTIPTMPGLGSHPAAESCGTIPTMPGLGSHPAAESIDINEMGDIEGLF